MFNHSQTLQIEALQHRVNKLLERAQRTTSGAESLLEDAISELRTSIEELRLAHEAMHRQRHELSSAYQLAASERRRYEELFEFAPDAYLVTDFDGTIREANRAAAAMLRCDRDALIGESLEMFVLETMRHAFRSRLLKALRSSSIKDWEFLLNLESGILKASATIASVSDLQGNASHLRWLLRDITERKEVEASLRSKTALVHLLQVIAVAANEASTIEDALQFTLEQVCAHTGWSIGQVYLPVRDSKWELLPGSSYLQDPERFEPFREATTARRLAPAIDLPGQVLVTGEPIWIPDVTKELTFLRAEQAKAAGIRASFAFPVLVGKEVVAILEFFSTEVLDPDEALLDVAANIGTQLGRVVERKRAEEQLRERERLAAMGATAFMLAHEISNPLNGMYSTAQILERYLAKHPDTADDVLISTVRDLMSEIKRLMSLLGDFRSLLRPQQLNFQPISLAAMVAELLSLETPQYAERGIHVEQSFPPDLPPVLVDGEKLRQVLLNLCKNAVDAMPEGGTLKVGAYGHGDQLVLEVSDTGVGIPQGVDIFELFTTTKPQGTGLGLAIVRQIISAHGGSITYTSEPGKGTTFRLNLPVQLRRGVRQEPAIDSHSKSMKQG